MISVYIEIHDQCIYREMHDRCIYREMHGNIFEVSTQARSAYTVNKMFLGQRHIKHPSTFNLHLVNHNKE